MKSEKLTSTEFMAQAGSLERVSDWILVDQQKIDKFAEATGDFQFIHVDEAKTKANTMFEGTIAHGFLSLSLLSTMIQNCFPSMSDAAMSINYGFEKVRFLNPVPSGARVRGHFKLLESAPRKPGEIMNRYQVSVEIENMDKPALVAEWLGLAILNKD